MAIRPGRILWLIALMALAAPYLLSAAEAPPTYRHFDSGKTAVLHIGDIFAVELERKSALGATWRWPAVPQDVVQLVSSEPVPEADETTHKTIHTFRAVAPGTVELFAELIDEADPTKVHARFALTVQVVEPETPGGDS